MKLTKTSVESLPNALRGQNLYFDSDLKGFGLLIGQTSKTYIVQRFVNGRTVRTTIGRHGVITAEIARREAQMLIGSMTKGENPNLIKQQEKFNNITLKQASDIFIASRKGNCKPGTIKEYEEIFQRHLKKWQGFPLKEINKAMVAERHQEIMKSSGGVSANLAMRLFRAIYRYAKVLDDSLPEHPVSYLSRTKTWAKEKRRQTVIKRTELKPWFDAVNELHNPTMRDYLLLLLFTGMRKNEAAHLCWRSLNFLNKTILIGDTKNGDSLELPMSDFVFDMLQKRYQGTVGKSEYVFPSANGESHMVEPRKAMQAVYVASGVKFILHDLRRTFISIAESLDISAYTLKRLVNHKISNDITGGYMVLDVERLRRPVQNISDLMLALAKGA